VTWLPLAVFVGWVSASPAMASTFDGDCAGRTDDECYRIGEGFFRTQEYARAARVFAQTEPGIRRSGNLGLLSDVLTYQAWAHHQLFDRETALEHQLQSLEIRQQINPPGAAATLGAASFAGELYDALGRFEEAQPYHEMAVEGHMDLDPHSPEAANVVSRLAYHYGAMGDLEAEEAQVLGAGAILLAHFGSDHPRYAVNLYYQGLVREKRGFPREALDLFERAFAIQMRRLGPTDETTLKTMMSLADLNADLGRMEKAVETDRAVLAAYMDKVGPTHPYTLRSQSGLATRLKDLGHFEEALPLFEKILEQLIEKYPDHANVARTQSNLAGLYAQMGRDREAGELHRQALDTLQRLFGERDDSTLRIRLNLANHLSRQGQYDEARSHIERVIEIHTAKSGPDDLRTAAALSSGAGMLVVEGRYDEGIDMAEQALRIQRAKLGDENAKVARTLEALSRYTLWSGQYEASKSYMLETLGIRRGIFGDDHFEVARDLFRLGHLAGLQHRTGDAVDLLGRGLSIQDRHANRVLAKGGSASNRAFVETFSRYTGAVVSFHIRDHEGDRAAAELAAQTLIRRKGIRIAAEADLLASARRRSGPEAEAALEELQVASSLLHKQDDQREPDPARLRAAELQVQTAERALAEAMPEYAALQSRLDLQISDVADALPPGAVFIDFIAYEPYVATEPPNHRSEARYAAYVIGPGGVRGWEDLGPTNEVDAAVGELLTAITTKAADADFKGPANAAYSLIIAPVEEHFGDASHLIVAPDRDLNLLPFDVLADPSGKYLLERYLVTWVTSGRDLLRPVGRASAGSTVLASGIDFGPARAETDAGALRFSSFEGRFLYDLMPGSNWYTNTLATREALADHRSPRLLHLASHGYYDAPATDRVRNPLLQSGVLMARANTDSSTNLTALEFSRWDLRETQLVVLSSCKSAAGVLSDGEGVLGLRTAATVAGSRTQVLTLWSIGDDSTAIFMDRFYRRMLRGVDKGEALRQTKLEFISAGKWTHPSRWGGFVLSGDAGRLVHDWNRPRLPTWGPSVWRKTETAPVERRRANRFAGVVFALMAFLAGVLVRWQYSVHGVTE